MASVRAQIFAAVEARLAAVVAELEWKALLINPRDPVGEDQLNALAMMHGGDLDPNGLTGGVQEAWLEFSVAMLVRETAAASAEVLLDAGFVAVSDILLAPDGIQLGGLVSDIRRGTVSDPAIGRAANGGYVLGAQAVDFMVHYFEREGDASTAGP